MLLEIGRYQECQGVGMILLFECCGFSRASMKSNETTSLVPCRLNQWGVTFITKSKHKKRREDVPNCFDGDGLSWTGTLIGWQRCEGWNAWFTCELRTRRDLRIPCRRDQMRFFERSVCLVSQVTNTNPKPALHPRLL